MDDSKKSDEGQKSDDRQVDDSENQDEKQNQTDDKQQESNEGTSDKSSDDSSGKSDDDSGDKSPEFKKRFTQIKGETQEEYLKNLEDAYLNSSNEGVRLNREIKDIKNADKDDKDKKSDTKLPDDPYLADLVRERKGKMEKEFDDFVDSHQELRSDEGLRDELLDSLEIVTEFHRKKGKPLTVKEGLKKAWAAMGNDPTNEQRAVDEKVKETAGKQRTQSKTKSADKEGDISEGTLSMAKKWGLDKKQIEEARKYAKDTYGK